jgi:hypothetical protein
MDVEERLARVQRRTALAERMQRQARTGIEAQPVTTIGSPPRTPAAEAVYEILLAIDPVLRRHAGLTVGIWTTPPPGTDGFPDAVAMISVDPVDQTLSLHFPVPSAAHPAEEPPVQPAVDGPDSVESVESVESVDVPDDPGPLSESPQASPEPSRNGVSEWDDPDEGEVSELVERAVEHVVGKAAGHPPEERPGHAADDGVDRTIDGSPQHASQERPEEAPEEAPPPEESLDGLPNAQPQPRQPLAVLLARPPKRAPEPPDETERGSVAHELAALLRYPDIPVP